MKKVNILISVVFIFFSIFILMESSNFQQTMISDNFVGAAFFPRVMAFIMIFLAIVLLVTSILDKNKRNKNIKEIFNKDMLMPITGIGIIFVYILLMDILGFIISTICLNFALLICFKVKNRLTLFTVPIFTSIIIYFVFKEMLIVPLPKGIFSL